MSAHAYDSSPAASFRISFRYHLLTALILAAGSLFTTVAFIAVRKQERLAVAEAFVSEASSDVASVSQGCDQTIQLVRSIEAHFKATDPMLFNREGDCLAAKLRPGNVHSAEGWEEVLLPEIERQQGMGKEVAFRADAAFAKPEIYEALEERGVNYAIRIPANDNLERDIAELLTRPVGRPSHKPVVWYKGFLYQAASWKTVRRVVAKVEHHAGELFPRVGFIVTNLKADSRDVVRFYNKRGTAEQWIKEGKQAVKMTRLSCHRFRSNEVRLWLSVIAYNLGNLWRRLALPRRIEGWSLTSLQQRLVKTGGRLVRHARYYWLLLAEGHLSRRLFGSMLRMIAALPLPDG